MSTVILVHGAMHTPWIFEPLIDRLLARGIAAHAVPLPSSNPDSAATGDLADDVTAVRDAIRAVDGPVVLAAHSYGGVPATWAAAEEPTVAELVYLAAFMLSPGTSMLDWMGGDFPPGWTRSPDGLAVKAGDPQQSIFSGVDPVLAAEAVKRLNWQGIGAFDQPLGAAPSDVGTTYIVATEDPALPPEIQQEWADHANYRILIPSGHSPHLSHPGEVAAVLTDAHARAGRSAR